MSRSSASKASAWGRKQPLPHSTRRPPASRRWWPTPATSPRRPERGTRIKGRRQPAPALLHSWRGAGCLSAENPLALLVDDLLALAERYVDRILQARETVGADEAVLLQYAVDFLRDDA